MNNVAVKDSKTKILEAFQRLLAEKQKIDSKVATKEEEAEKEKNKKTIEVASTYTVDSIVKGLADLQLEFGSIITGLSSKLTAETTKLDELKKAIVIENQHLQELQQVRVVADALHILNQEHQEKLRSIEENATNQRETLDKQITETRKNWQKEQEEFTTTIREQTELLTAERQRQEADYQYELERDRKIKTDEYEEFRRKLERELQQSNQEKEKDWTERERILTTNQTLFEEYRKKVEAFPAEMDEATKKAYGEGISEVNQEAKVKSDLFEKEWEASKQSYELKIHALEQKIQRQTEQITELTNQLQNALKQAQDLAMRAFESSSAKTTKVQ
ncbi:hypothetical protein IQ264_18670 [Phormidium sp. LEGE 05292]|uniref:hypothetical protein n=1 Tax=[Phormidium] sp. LEGE 05292 TaxID=767427 RepID=UPI001881C441|nr:hypothetical protein [Phormidium sp. LEGE 05292]MBE9227455.1 hypothetical protein [Phormidium sp. LEGE 05292]